MSGQASLAVSQLLKEKENGTVLQVLHINTEPGNVADIYISLTFSAFG